MNVLETMKLKILKRLFMELSETLCLASGFFILKINSHLRFKGIGGFMLTSLFTFSLTCIRLCAQKESC